MHAFVHGGAKLCSAGHGGLTHIAVVLFIVKLAAAGDGLGLGRGIRRALLFIIICVANISCCALGVQCAAAFLARTFENMTYPISLVPWLRFVSSCAAESL
jgi:hypothetical protein